VKRGIVHELSNVWNFLMLRRFDRSVKLREAHSRPSVGFRLLLLSGETRNRTPRFQLADSIEVASICGRFPAARRTDPNHFRRLKLFESTVGAFVFILFMASSLFAGVGDRFIHLLSES
jgi:hypothetical protein